MICDQCEAPVTTATARAFQAVGGPKRMLCESCHVQATAVAGESRGFEYRLCALNSPDGIQRVEDRLNMLAASGWRMLPVTIQNGNFAVLERAR